MILFLFLIFSIFIEIIVILLRKNYAINLPKSLNIRLMDTSDGTPSYSKECRNKESEFIHLRIRLNRYQKKM